MVLKKMNPSSLDIGTTIRKIRKEKGLTLAKLSEMCRCSSSLISQIETGSVNPSFSSLKSISDALEISMATLFTGKPILSEQPFSLMQEHQRKSLTTQGGVNFQLLSRGMDFPCEFILNHWPPGSSTGGMQYTHEGEECGYLIEGELDIEIEGEVVHMKPGDTITLPSTVPHRVSNPGKQKAVAVWVNSKPMIFAIK